MYWKNIKKHLQYIDVKEIYIQLKQNGSCDNSLKEPDYWRQPTYLTKVCKGESEGFNGLHLNEGHDVQPWEYCVNIR